MDGGGYSEVSLEKRDLDKSKKYIKMSQVALCSGTITIFFSVARYY
jgi:hypothetical protein